VRGDDTTASELASVVRDVADDEAIGRRARAFSAQFADQRTNEDLTARRQASSTRATS